MTQNRMSAVADKRADLDLHIVLLTEHELTRLADLLMRIAERLDIPAETEPSLNETRTDISPDAVLDEIERQRGDDAEKCITTCQPLLGRRTNVRMNASLMRSDEHTSEIQSI